MWGSYARYEGQAVDIAERVAQELRQVGRYLVHRAASASTARRLTIDWDRLFCHNYSMKG